MEKCRICLENKKNIRCIFDTFSNNTYHSMITSLANVKISKDDGITDKICLGCRKKLGEAYDFKLLIEKSDAELQCSTNCKKINFNNLEDVKIKVEIAGHGEYVPKYENDILFKDGQDSIFYNGTTIKKIVPCDQDIKKEDAPLSVLEFLNNIDDNPENNFGDDDNVDVDYEQISDDGDDEYLLPLSIRKNQCAKKKKRNKKTAPIKSKERKNYNHKETLQKVLKPIKPVYLSDIRVVPTKPRKNPNKPISKKSCLKEKMCNYCGKMTTTLKSHLLTHTGEKKFKCNVCGKAFITRGGLRNHELKHVSSKTLKCDYCIASFNCKTALKSHMISHSAEMKFKCNVCSKPFKRRAALRRHEMMHNVTNKNINCELCNMSFFTKYSLNHHMRVHTGERPYNCELCSQPYSYKHDFNRHCLKKHGVFLKRRYVNVMNEEVLKTERALMRDLMLKLHGFVKEGENINPFEGPQAAQAFEMAVKALKNRQIPIDYNV